MPSSRCLPLVAGLVVALCGDHPATAAGHARFPRAAAEPIFGPSARSVLEQFETGRQGAQRRARASCSDTLLACDKYTSRRDCYGCGVQCTWNFANRNRKAAEFGSGSASGGDNTTTNASGGGGTAPPTSSPTATSAAVQSDEGTCSASTGLGGIPECQCLTPDAARKKFATGPTSYVDRNGVITDFQGNKFPTDYGSDGCKPYDRLLEPYCADANGAPKDGAPEWCRESWCWIDRDACSLPIVSESSYFPGSGLDFSYQTCGEEGTWASWFQDGGKEFGLHTIDELATVVEDNVKAIVRTLEGSIDELRGLPGDCDVEPCNCPTCYDTPWKDGDGNPIQNDFTRANFKASARGNVEKLSQCLASVGGGAFSRIAAAEYTDDSRIGYFYMGMQVDGSFEQWPASNFCDPNYDPRFRPWYSSAASGPKKVVILVDVSGSMGSAGRIGLAKDAVIAVLDTLSWKDEAMIITFNDDVQGISTSISGGGLITMSEDEIKAQKKWAETNIIAGGGTNFVAPIRKALDVLDKNTDESCQNIVLFLTDGEASFAQRDYDFVSSQKAKNQVTIFSYALGNGAKREVGQKVSELSGGQFNYIEDGGDLKGAMSSYYTFFADRQQSRAVRWLLYSDFITGFPLLGACAPFYDAVDPATNIAPIIGVVCMDMNVIVQYSEVALRPDFEVFNKKIEKENSFCPNTKDCSTCPTTFEWTKAGRVTGTGGTGAGGAGGNGAGGNGAGGNSGSSNKDKDNASSPGAAMSVAVTAGALAVGLFSA